MLNSLPERVRVKKVGCIPKQERNRTSDRPDRERSHAPGRGKIEHECQCHRHHLISENCEPTASASDNPSSTMRRQFHSTTSRGAYRVWATAMAVKIAPNAPQAAPISGSADQTALARMIPGEKQ